jgi:oligopeptide/dipeptide ABC transporter ATP-binding protein
MSDAVLEIRNLRTSFATRQGTYQAVDGIDLTVHAGKTLCLVGESGSGKSVTALSIMGLVDKPGRVEAGSEIRLSGTDIAGYSDKEMRRLRGRELTMIFQEPMTSLDPVYTVGYQIIEAIRVHQDMSRRAARARAVELMGLVGIPSPERRIDDYPHQLSGGMRQRVMIATALSSSPKVLIADEPTTALDVTIQAQILDLMRRLQSELGMAILMITHDLGVVAEMADDVAVMYAGRIVENGSVADIFSSPQHPYSEALLHSVPVLGMDKERPLRVIPGMVPSLLHPMPGCRFQPRCHVSFDRCSVEEPSLFPVGRQQSACWHSAAGRRDTTGVRGGIG